jgi:uncharacterized protein (TIGR04540 family)
MISQYIKDPGTIKDLAFEIKKITDDYWGRRIHEASAKELIFYWSKYHGDKFFMGADLNPTVKIIIGKKRINLINLWLNETQIKF